MSKGVILIVEDDHLQRRLIKENLEQEGYQVFESSSGKEALMILNENLIDCAVVDYKLTNETGINVIKEILERNPFVTAIMVTAFGNIENAVEALKVGAYDYLVKPIDFKKLLHIIARAIERQKLKKEISLLQKSLEDKFTVKNFIFTSSAMESVARLIAKASKSDANTLISGDTGTGKDLVAKTIHYSSRRQKGPYLAVNIPSLPESLIESELFGAEKGSFTGAFERKIGKFEAAAGGTLFLDEIGDLPAHIQVKLLRAIQEKEILRLGSSKPVKVDVRIIAATNQDLEKLVKEEKFRPDLFYRLNVIRIHVPALTKRKEDIPALVDHFIRKYSAREQKNINSISAEAMHFLLNYSYPGNIRELENIIERAVVFAEGETIVASELPLFLKENDDKFFEDEQLSLTDKVKHVEKREIKKALDASHGVKSKAARSLGITERMLSYKMKNYGIK